MGVTPPPPPLAILPLKPLTAEMIDELQKCFDTWKGNPTKVMVLPAECEATLYQFVDGRWVPLPGPARLGHVSRLILLDDEPG